MSGRVETDAGALTARERIPGEGSRSWSCQELVKGKLAEIELESGVCGPTKMCVCVCVSPPESDWYRMCIYIQHPCTPFDTDLLHPDSRSFLGSPEDHGLVHGGWEETERLLQFATFRGRQSDTETTSSVTLSNHDTVKSAHNSSHSCCNILSTHYNLSHLTNVTPRWGKKHPDFIMKQQQDYEPLRKINIMMAALLLNCALWSFELWSIRPSTISF